MFFTVTVTVVDVEKKIFLDIPKVNFSLIILNSGFRIPVSGFRIPAFRVAPKTMLKKLQLAGHSYSTRSMEYAFKQQLAKRDYYNSSKNNFRMEQTPRGNHIVQFTGCF